MPVIKSFNTILKSRKVRGKTDLKKPVLTKTLPKWFNPITTWGTYLSPVRDQNRCGNCYAQSCVGSLADRFALFTLGQVRVVLSPYQPTICAGVINSEQHIIESNERIVNRLVHSSLACNGNTIENMMDYLYTYGTQERGCFDLGILKKQGITLDSDITDSNQLPFCGKVIGQDYGRCVDTKTHAQFYRCMAYYDVYPNVDCIQNEIFHWGTVVTGMVMYDSFTNFDGKTIYMGPEEKEDPIGGHAICLVGWGSEPVPYWLARNSWGTDYGLNGYFKIKMGVCEVEQNVMALIPDIKNFDLNLLDYKPIITPSSLKEREWFGIDPITGYKISSLSILKKAKPLFKIDKLPDFKTFWAGEITELQFENSSRTYKNLRNKYIYTNYKKVFALFVFSFFIVYFILKRH